MLKFAEIIYRIKDKKEKKRKQLFKKKKKEKKKIFKRKENYKHFINEWISINKWAASQITFIFSVSLNLRNKEPLYLTVLSILEGRLLTKSFGKDGRLFEVGVYLNTEIYFHLNE